MPEPRRSSFTSLRARLTQSGPTAPAQGGLTPTGHSAPLMRLQASGSSALVPTVAALRLDGSGKSEGLNPESPLARAHSGLAEALQRSASLDPGLQKHLLPSLSGMTMPSGSGLSTPTVPVGLTTAPSSVHGSSSVGQEYGKQGPAQAMMPDPAAAPERIAHAHAEAVRTAYGHAVLTPGQRLAAAMQSSPGNVGAPSGSSCGGNNNSSGKLPSSWTSLSSQPLTRLTSDSSTLYFLHSSGSNAMELGGCSEDGPGAAAHATFSAVGSVLHAVDEEEHEGWL